MNKILKTAFALSLGLLLSTNMFAGDPDRSGQAGATQLVVNPWPSSSGLGGSNMGSIGGVEAMNLNPAGILNVRNNEFEV